MKKFLKTLVLLFLLCVVLLALPPVRRQVEQRLYPRKYNDLVEQYAAEYDLDPLLVYSFIRTESGFDPGATSSVDARGLMQMTEETFLWLRSKLGLGRRFPLATCTTPMRASALDAITSTSAWCVTTAISPRPPQPTTAGGAPWMPCSRRKNTRRTG